MIFNHRSQINLTLFNQYFFRALLLVMPLFSGCVPAVFIGGVATGALVADDRRDSGTIIQDEAIELNARSALDDDLQLRNETHINVTSFNHIVLISGQAPTTILRYRAENIVRNLKHVKLVYNELVIAPPSALTTRAADTLITSRVKSYLFNSKNVSSNHVKVVTESGIVFLMGILNNIEAEAATNAARKAAGVLKVVRLFEPLN